VQSLTYNNAKTNFDEMLRLVQREPIEILKNGKSVAIVMSHENYQELEKMKLGLLEFRPANLDEQKRGEVVASAVDADVVFGLLEADRQSQQLSEDITGSTVRYQVSRTHPGLLERIDRDGHITHGTFKDGVFIPKTKT